MFQVESKAQKSDFILKDPYAWISFNLKLFT